MSLLSLAINAWGKYQRDLPLNQTSWTFRIKMIMFIPENVPWNITTLLWLKIPKIDLFMPIFRKNWWIITTQLRFYPIKYPPTKNASTADSIRKQRSKWSPHARVINSVGMRGWTPIQLWIKVRSWLFHSPRVHLVIIQNKLIIILQTLITKIGTWS